MADALSHKSLGSLVDVPPEKKEIVHESGQLASLGVRLAESGGIRVLDQKFAESSIIEKIKHHQYEDPIFAQYRDTGLDRENTPFRIISDGVLLHRERFYVPDVDGLRRQVMGEAHYARLYIKEIVNLHRDPVSIITNRGAQFTANFWRSFLEVVGTQTLEDMLQTYVIDFRGNWEDHLPLVEFAYINSYHSSIQMAPYEALYCRKCRSPVGWFDVGETKLIGPNLIQQAVDKVKLIRKQLLASQSRQKVYRDNRRRPLEFQLGEVHLIFHVSMLRKFIGYPSRVFPVKDIQVTEELSYEEQSVAILDCQIRRLRTKYVSSVKVLWRNNHREEMT
ncbi:uncharacterized protein LOC129869754 [Solanum dulcamara]|uniref:uncharacterized protein LOC129869754 n=1 Tax=Solanum dulcamara TaxID=45834 RepID=UPI0024866A69|nr:uncharacterized protein LOC129869754 [Solanum dulcamara]